MRTITLLSTALLVFHSAAALAAEVYQPIQVSEAQIQQPIPMQNQNTLRMSQREPILVAPAAAPAQAPVDSSSASHLMRFNFGI